MTKQSFKPWQNGKASLTPTHKPVILNSSQDLLNPVTWKYVTPGLIRGPGEFSIGNDSGGEVTASTSLDYNFRLDPGLKWGFELKKEG
jgi:hypothetical protein